MCFIMETKSCGKCQMSVWVASDLILPTTLVVITTSMVVITTSTLVLVCISLVSPVEQALQSIFKLFSTRPKMTK